MIPRNTAVFFLSFLKARERELAELGETPRAVRMLNTACHQNEAITMGGNQYTCDHRARPLCR